MTTYKITHDGADMGYWQGATQLEALAALRDWQVHDRQLQPPPHTYRERGGVATITLTDGTVYQVEVVP